MADIKAVATSVAQPGISESSFSTESSGPNYETKSSAMKEPLERLLKAVQSLSPKSLSASVSEISSALKTVDAISGTACNDYEVDVDENLASETRCCMRGWNFSFQCGRSSEKKMKHKRNAIALDETDILKPSAGQIWDTDTTRIITRRRIEPLRSASPPGIGIVLFYCWFQPMKPTFYHVKLMGLIRTDYSQPSNTLLDEIKCINQWLIETEIDLDSPEDPSAFDAGEGTIVRCVYSAVALDENFKMQFAPQMLPLPLRLFVPASYPNASPVILGGGESIGSISLSEKTRSRFSLSLRKLSEPMSLAEMAMTWDICARTVLLEYAQSVDGGCFSSKYGKWENCVTA
ncbi:hypothetical protein CUMW_007230 [Citrus unshiu]|nr:hypothetical protein CUMW_007230 [Citrus unshiu]